LVALALHFGTRAAAPFQGNLVFEVPIIRIVFAKPETILTVSISDFSIGL
jgi:hypothetical protein